MEDLMLIFKVEKKIHHLWRKTGNRIVGKWQYVYSSKKGKISLIEFINYYGDGKGFWEIYCTEGNLSVDTERFSSKENAEIRIKQLLSK